MMMPSRQTASVVQHKKSLMALANGRAVGALQVLGRTRAYKVAPAHTSSVIWSRQLVMARPAIENGDGGAIGVFARSSFGVAQRLGAMQTGLQQKRVAYLLHASAHTKGCQAAWECHPHRSTTSVAVMAALSSKVHEQLEVARDAHAWMVNCNVMLSLVTEKKLLT
jgi:hypothetical protein